MIIFQQDIFLRGPGRGGRVCGGGVCGEGVGVGGGGGIERRQTPGRQQDRIKVVHF